MLFVCSIGPEKKKAVSDWAKRGRALLAAGIICILLAVSLIAYNDYSDSIAGENARYVASQMRTELKLPETFNVAPDPISAEIELYIETLVEIDGRSYLGEIRVPVLDLTLPVLSEWSTSNAKLAPCRYWGGVGSADLIIAGHNYKTHFGNLSALVPGDTVCFIDAAGREFEYIVSALETLCGNDTENMLSGDWDLTLFTCTYGGRNRLAVRCESAKGK